MTVAIGCSTCGHISCVCRVKKKHKEDCPFRLAVTCAVGIECEHGYDVCPTCDPCTCEKSDAASAENEEQGVPGRVG